MNARLSFNTARELGFRGSLDEWERLMERLQGGEHKIRSILPSGQRVIIGFCLIRQSSVSPIVSVHQSNQLSGPHSIGIPRHFMVVPWVMSGGLGAPAALPFG